MSAWRAACVGRGALALVVAAFMFSCKFLASNSSDVVTVASPSAAWRQDSIDVCWEIMSEGTKDYRIQVQQAIKEQFAGFVIPLRGFRLCPPSGGDIRVFIYDDEDSKGSTDYNRLVAALKSAAVDQGGGLSALGHPRVLRIGQAIKGVPAGLVLNRKFEDSAPGFQALRDSFSQQGRVNLSITVALHEFGHALGLRHEDAHTQATCTDFAEDPGSGPDKAVDITPYNAFSFMSRCYYRSYNYNLGQLLPNDRDIQGLNVLHAHQVPRRPLP